MNQVKTSNKVTSITPRMPLAQDGLQVGKITSKNQGNCQIDLGLLAKTAMSCLIKPELGDQVLYYQQGETCWIIAVLNNAPLTAQTTQSGPVVNQTKDRILAIDDDTALTVEAARFTVNAKDSIHLHAAHNIQLSAILGKLSISAKTLIQSVQDSCISLAKHWLNRAEYIDQEAEKLLKTHAQHQLITAQKDVKVDAERINMG